MPGLKFLMVKLVVFFFLKKTGTDSPSSFGHLNAILSSLSNIVLIKLTLYCDYFWLSSCSFDFLWMNFIKSSSCYSGSLFWAPRRINTSDWAPAIVTPHDWAPISTTLFVQSFRSWSPSSSACRRCLSTWTASSSVTTRTEATSAMYSFRPGPQTRTSSSGSTARPWSRSSSRARSTSGSISSSDTSKKVNQ